MLQKNAFLLEPGSELLFTFDLKGSSFRRTVLPESAFVGAAGSLKKENPSLSEVRKELF